MPRYVNIGTIIIHVEQQDTFLAQHIYESYELYKSKFTKGNNVINTLNSTAALQRIFIA